MSGFENITIMIPTLGRLNKQETLGNLTPELLGRTKLLVDSSEFEDHEDKYGLTCDVVSLPDDMNGISKIRQWSLENCDTDYLFLLDDDMKFFKRDELDIKLHICSDLELNELFEELISWMEVHNYPIVGVSARQGNNHVLEDYRDATRQMNFHGLDCNRIKSLGIKFDEFEVMEDFNMTLSLLTLGIPNRVMYEYCWNQLGSGAQGGCSGYRTSDVQANAARGLAAKFPEFVKVVEKKSKSGWEGLETRIDVRIQWKKAFIKGLEENEL